MFADRAGFGATVHGRPDYARMVFSARHYAPDSLRTDQTTRTAAKDVFATASLILGAIVNVGIGLIVALRWR
jgi:hypothetical protein